MKEINGFDDSLHYVNRFIAFPREYMYPGWIVQAQHRLCNAVSLLEKAADDSDWFWVHFTRKTQTFQVYDYDTKEPLGIVKLSEF